MDNNRPNPFPGLRPFREGDEHLFFAREKQVDSMVDKLARSRFLAVVGASGGGKSSLVNCGLRPALHRGAMARAGTSWRIAQFRPGRNPIRAMACALAAEGVLFRGYRPEGLSLEEIVEATLRMSRIGLVDAYEQAQPGERVNLLVIVDQFEELFRFGKLGTTNADRSAALQEAMAFVNLLLAAKAEPGFPIYVVLTMRSDFLGDCTQFPGLAEAINEAQYLTPRMTREERRLAIEGPVAVGAAKISPVLLTRLVNDVGDNPDQLSILQHALNRTWARWRHDDPSEPLSLKHYEDIGTMTHALDLHAEKAWSELDEAGQRVCEKVFRALTDTGTDPRGIRRPTTIGKLCAIAAAPPAEVKAVIEVFRKPSRSFLMPPYPEPLNDDTVVDISHESLMRVWKRLKVWADAEAQSSHLYRRLSETAGLHANGKAGLWRDPDLRVALDWRRAEQPTAAWAGVDDQQFTREMSFLEASQRAARRDGQLRWGIGVIAVVALAGGLFGFWRLRENERDSEYQRLQAAAMADLNGKLKNANGKLENANGELKRTVGDLELSNADKDALGAQLKALNGQLKVALGQESRARTQAEKDREKARGAERAATDAATKIGEQRVREQQLNAELTNEKANLQKANDDLDRNAKALKDANARIGANAEFERLVNSSANSDPVEYLGSLVDALDSYRQKHPGIPSNALITLEKAVSNSFLSGSEVRPGIPVLLAVPDAKAPAGMRVVRTGEAADAKLLRAPRGIWTVEESANQGKGLAVGGPGGYVALLRPGATAPAKAYRVHPFAITGMGFSTDGEWLVTASGAGDLRLIRTDSFDSTSVVKLLQFGNPVKLAAFLLFHRYEGEYAVRSVALSVKPATGARTERGDVTVYALTASGRLIRWDHPGPLGKQLGKLEKYLVGTAGDHAQLNFTTINTNPATQVVWAASRKGFGMIQGRDFTPVKDLESIIPISAASWNETGKLLALGYRDGAIRIYEPQGQAADPRFGLVLSLQGDATTINSLTWEGEMLASGSAGGAARLWNLRFTPPDRDVLRALSRASASERQLYTRPINSTDDLVEQYDLVEPMVKRRLATRRAGTPVITVTVR